MAYFDNRPQHFRLVAVLYAGALLVLAGMNFVRNASRATDENLFRTSPSRLYVIRSLATVLPAAGLQAGPQAAVARADSVRAGDFLIACNRREIEDAADWQQARQGVAPDSVIALKLFRPAQGEGFTIRLAAAALPDSCVLELPPSIYIVGVEKGGASDRAGLLPGDVILRINQQSFRDAVDADRIMRRAGSGQTIDYEVRRGPRSLTLHVTLARLGVSLGMVISLLIGLAFLGLGLFLTLHRPRIRAARLVGLVFMAFSFPVLLTHQQGAEAGLLSQILFAAIIANILFGTATGIHSSFYFPKERPELLQNPWLGRVPYVLAAAAFAVIGGLGFAQSALARLLFLATLGLMLLYYFVVFLIHRRQCSVEYKRLSRSFKAIAAAAVVGMLVLNLLLVRKVDQANTGVLLLPLLLLPGGYLYFIGRHRLLDVNLRVRRNTQYTIVSAVWTVLLLLLMVTALAWLPKLKLNLPDIRFNRGYLEIGALPMSPDQHQFAEKIILMALAMALIFVFQKLGRAGQNWIARLFHRESYDYRVATSELAEVMATKLSMVDLARGIVKKLAELMHLERVGVMFFQNQKVCCCQEAYGFDGEEWQAFCIATDQQIVQVLEKFRSESRFTVDYLPDDLKDNFYHHGFRHLIPIRFKEKLVGTLLLGEKLSEAAYTHEDFAILTAVAKQASVAVENAFLYEELAEQERLKHELAIARRIQLASLPQTTPAIAGLEIAGVSIPAHEVGGDYFDYLNGKPHKITVIVGDVSGKGTSAALYMSKVQGILRSLHDFGLSPRDLFIRANHLLRQALERKSFVTSIGADFDTQARRLVLARAGHLPLFHYCAPAQAVVKVTPRGLGLGLDEEFIFAAELEEKTIPYAAGDVFLFVTDGVTEADDGHGGEFGEEPLIDILLRHHHRPAAQIRDQLITALRGFSNNTEQRDDQTIVVVKATP